MPADDLPPLPPEFDPRGRKHARRVGATPPSVISGPIAAPARAPRRARSGGLHSFRIMARVISACLSIFLVAYIGFLWSKVHGVDKNVSRVVIASIGGGEEGQSGGSGGATGHRYDIDGKDQNLLIVGNDDRSDLTASERTLLKTGSDVSLSTDTMMIIHVPADGSKATLISLPRDSYVAIPGYGMNKLNSAYSDGYLNSSGDTDAKRAAGANLLVETVQNLTGLNIDHYVQVGLIGFYRIAKAIHGVPVNLCNNVNDTVAYDKATGQGGGSGFKMSKGKHTLDAVQALEFVRQRHNLPNGDLDRTKRQRYFLTAAFRKIASAGVLLNPSKLGDLVNAVDKSLYVDSGLNILDLAKQMANLSANNIVGKAIPFDGFNNNSPVGSVEVVNPTEVQRFVAKLITSGNSNYTKAKVVDPSTVTVSVENAGRASGSATNASKLLSGVGFQSSIGADQSTQSQTVIEYPVGMEAQAKTLAQYVPGASVQTGDVTTLTLELGNDNAAVNSTPTTPKASTSTKPPKALDSGCIN